MSNKIPFFIFLFLITVLSQVNTAHAQSWPCGDFICDLSAGETVATCANDCGSCGDGYCNGGENTFFCPTDCGTSDPDCGDGVCDYTYCGDSYCANGETSASCVQDCDVTGGALCGDGLCNGVENGLYCPQDCGAGGGGPVCGDGICSSGEPGICSADCSSGTDPEICGNGLDDDLDGDIDSADSDCGGGGGSSFTLLFTPTSQSVTQGGSVSYVIDVIPSGLFTETVNLTYSSCDGYSCSFNNASINYPYTSRFLTIVTSAGTPITTDTFNITGTALSATDGESGDVTVLAPILPPILGSCGTANKPYAYNASSYGVDTFCGAGIFSWIGPGASGSFPAQGASKTWTCVGQNGGADSPTCTASRANSPATLSVNVVTTGQGTVTSTSNPTQTNINCGALCVATYEAGTQVTLTATPASASRIFIGWSGDCSGTNPICVLTVNSAKSVTARFGINPNFKEF